MEHQDFPITPEQLLTAILAFFGIAAAIGLLAFLVAWAWRLPERLPSRLTRLQDTHATALEAARRESTKQEQAAAKARGDVDAVQAELGRHRLQAATLQASLEEARQQGSRLEEKALQAVQEATAKEAATAAKAKRLDHDLAAANRTAAEAMEAYRKLAEAAEQLQARHNETLADLVKLRDCDHLEQATVYTRETDPATGSRPYKSQGLMCKRCHYVQAMPSNGAAAVVQAVAANG